MNKQLYENSGLRELFSESAAAGSDPSPGFFNAREPNLAIMHEKPEHRVLLMLKAQGLSNREIAGESGYTEPWLSQLFRQPWAQAALADYITKTGLDEVSMLLKSAAVPSIHKLIELRDSKGVPPAVVRNVCVDLLDRFMGKPAQHVHVESSTTSSAESVAEIDKRADEINQEINRLTGSL